MASEFASRGFGNAYHQQSCHCAKLAPRRYCFRLTLCAFATVAALLGLAAWLATAGNTRDAV